MMLLAGCDDGNNGGGTPATPIDYSYMLGASFNYCGLYRDNYKAMIDVLANHKINMLRIFGYNGWNDNPTYKPCTGNDLTQIDPAYIQRVKDFVNYANSKGIIVIFSLFHNNGDPYSWIAHQNGNIQRVYLQAVYNALKDNAVIWEALNEDVDVNFDNYVRNEIHSWGNPNAKCCFYNVGGAEYRITHTANKNYVGGGVIQSTDTPQLVNLNDNDLLNIATQAKQQSGHVEYLMYWSRNGGATSTTPEQLEANFGGALDALQALR